MPQVSQNLEPVWVLVSLSQGPQQHPQHPNTPQHWPQHPNPPLVSSGPFQRAEVWLFLGFVMQAVGLQYTSASSGALLGSLTIVHLGPSDVDWVSGCREGPVSATGREGAGVNTWAGHEVATPIMFIFQYVFVRLFQLDAAVLRLIVFCSVFSTRPTVSGDANCFAVSSHGRRTSEGILIMPMIQTC